MKNYWLFKTEPSTYSIDDLAEEKRTYWEGIRNYQARNLIRDDMKVSDGVLIYHSIVKPMGVYGVAKIVRAAYPDHTAFDKSSRYFDRRSTVENPVWYMVDIEIVEKFDSPITLEQIKADPVLSEMMVARRGARLSIQPVDKKHFNKILKLGG